MNKDKYVFAQLVSFLDNFKFLRIVKSMTVTSMSRVILVGINYLRCCSGSFLIGRAFGILSSHWKRMQARSIISESENP